MTVIEYVNVCYESVKNEKLLKKDLLIVHISGGSVLAEVKKDLCKLYNSQKDECQLTLKFMLLVTVSKDLGEIKKTFVDFLKGLLSHNVAQVGVAIANVDQLLEKYDVDDVITKLNNESILEHVCEIDSDLANNSHDSTQSKFFQDFFRLYLKCIESFPEMNGKENRTIATKLH